MDEVVDILTEKGLLEESQRCSVVNLEKYGIEHPALIKKSDGATLYITRAWLPLFTANVLMTLPKPSTSLVTNNQLTSNN